MIYFLFLASFFMFFAGITGFLSAPYVPTRKRDVARFLELAEIKAGDVVYDLGCGDGRILSAAAKCGAKKAIGLELSIPNYLFCKIFRPRITTRFKNFFTVDFSDADLVYMFLSPAAHNKMEKILKKQLKPGARVIAYVWPIDGWEPLRINKKSGWPDLYLYRV